MNDDYDGGVIGTLSENDKKVIASIARQVPYSEDTVIKIYIRYDCNAEATLLHI